MYADLDNIINSGKNAMQTNESHKVILNVMKNIIWSQISVMYGITENVGIT